jgi:hypothetical protein
VPALAGIVLAGLAGCSQTASDRPPAPAVVQQPAPTPPVDPKEALAQRNRMLQRQREYWLKHGQGH